MSLKGNKGDWSEIYTLFKLLADGGLKGGDADLKKIESQIYPILKIIRQESGDFYEYVLGDEHSVVVISKNSKILFKKPISEFVAQASALLAHIKKGTGSFELPSIELFMKQIGCQSIKAASSLKTDITIQIQDAKAGFSPVLGFSIWADPLRC